MFSFFFFFFFFRFFDFFDFFFQIQLLFNTNRNTLLLLLITFKRLGVLVKPGRDVDVIFPVVVSRIQQGEIRVRVARGPCRAPDVISQADGASLGPLHPPVEEARNGNADEDQEGDDDASNHSPV